MNRRQFTKRAAATVALAGLSGSAFKCGSEKVSIYMQTISSFLNEIAGLIPAQAAFIAKIVKVASDFDTAYRRGDLANASAFFNTLDENITTLFTDIGVNVSAQVKVALAIVRSTLKLVAVLLKEQGDAQPIAVAKARTMSVGAAKSASAIERLADQSSIDALYQAARP